MIITKIENLLVDRFVREDGTELVLPPDGGNGTIGTVEYINNEIKNIYVYVDDQIKDITGVDTSNLVTKTGHETITGGKIFRGIEPISELEVGDAYFSQGVYVYAGGDLQNIYMDLNGFHVGENYGFLGSHFKLYETVYSFPTDEINVISAQGYNFASREWTNENYVTLSTDQTITGAKTFESNLLINSDDKEMRVEVQSGDTGARLIATLYDGGYIELDYPDTKTRYRHDYIEYDGSSLFTETHTAKGALAFPDLGGYLNIIATQEWAKPKFLQLSHEEGLSQNISTSVAFSNLVEFSGQTVNMYAQLWSSNPYQVYGTKYGKDNIVVTADDTGTEYTLTLPLQSGRLLTHWQLTPILINDPSEISQVELVSAFSIRPTTGGVSNTYAGAKGIYIPYTLGGKEKATLFIMPDGDVYSDYCNSSGEWVGAQKMITNVGGQTINGTLTIESTLTASALIAGDLVLKYNGATVVDLQEGVLTTAALGVAGGAIVNGDLVTKDIYVKDANQNVKITLGKDSGKIETTGMVVAGSLQIYNGKITKAYIDTSGNASVSQLQVNSTADFKSTVDFAKTITAVDITASGLVTAASFLASSDRRLKENIKTYQSKKSILDLDVKEFNFIGDNKKQIGCIAQELQELFPELVVENENGYLAIAENKLVYLLLNEVKTLKARLDAKEG